MRWLREGCELCLDSQGERFAHLGFSRPNSQAQDDLKREFIVAAWARLSPIINAFTVGWLRHTSLYLGMAPLSLNYLGLGNLF